MANIAASPVRVPGNAVAPATELLPTVAYDDALTALLGTSTLEAWSRTTHKLIPAQYGGYTHAFIDTLNVAYQNHYSLSLSPDMIWLLIAQGFATHVNQNQEALRKRLVAHEGKISLEVRRDEFVRGFAGNDWEGVFDEFSEQIRAHIGDLAHDTLVPNFSTTGIVEKAAFELTLLDTLQGYFTYTLQTLCGIPTYLLEGTPDDWKHVREKAAALTQYKLAWWTQHLLPVLDQFVAASEGNPDPDFWKSFYKWSNDSGGPYITGHIVNLFPYLVEKQPTRKTEAEIEATVERILKSIQEYFESENGVLDNEEKEAVRSRLLADELQKQSLRDRFYPNPSLGKRHRKLTKVDFLFGIPEPKPNEFGYFEGLTSSNLPSALSLAPFTWKYLETELSMEFVAGFVGATQDPDTLALRSEIGWAVREK